MENDIYHSYVDFAVVYMKTIHKGMAIDWHQGDIRNCWHRLNNLKILIAFGVREIFYLGHHFDGKIPI